MDLFLIRHAEAVPHGDPHYAEDERPLTATGLEQSRALAAALKTDRGPLRPDHLRPAGAGQANCRGARHRIAGPGGVAPVLERSGP